MTRISMIAALGLLGLVTMGCSSGNKPILAEAPGGTEGQANLAPGAGAYTLYHVTEYDMWGAPAKAVKIDTVNVKQNERVGFSYDMADKNSYQGDARSDVIAFVGSSYHKNLGPIQTMSDHYYWADPNGWDTYWAARPERVLGNKAMQN